MFKCVCELCDPDSDWEATGQEEVQKILDKKMSGQAAILDARDRLNNTLELLKVCRDALEDSTRLNINSTISNILYFYVEKEIKLAEEDLACINLI